MRTFRNLMGWIFAAECLLVASVIWMIHFPPQYGQSFIHGGYASPPLTIVEICAFYFALVFILGTAWWTTWKEKSSSRIWGITASIASLFLYADPSYWYQIHKQGVWVHWAICLIGLIVFSAPRPERSTADASPDRLGDDLPNAGICYAFGILFPVAYLFTRRRNRQNAFLRFHSIQRLILFSVGALCELSPNGWLGDVSSVVFLIVFICYLVALSKASQHKQFRLPFISTVAERLT